MTIYALYRYMYMCGWSWKYVCHSLCTIITLLAARSCLLWLYFTILTFVFVCSSSQVFPLSFSAPTPHPLKPHINNKTITMQSKATMNRKCLFCLVHSLLYTRIYTHRNYLSLCMKLYCMFCTEMYMTVLTCLKYSNEN